MDKKAKIYTWSHIILIVFSLVCLHWFFILSITIPNQTGFLINRVGQWINSSSTYAYKIDPRSLFYLNYTLNFNIALNASGIASIVLFICYILTFIFNLIMIGIIRSWRPSLLHLIIAILIWLAILYLFIIIMIKPNFNQIINNSYYTWLKNVIFNDQTLTLNKKNVILNTYINHYHLPIINDPQVALLDISKHQINNENLTFNPSYNYNANLYFTKAKLIYCTYTIIGIIFIISFIYYLSEIIKRCLLVNDNWKIKQHERKDGLNIKKRKNKQEIVAPDPILEEIFKELDL
ncbi:hypothetical protein WFS18_01015 [Ureaplasma parvum]|uniref:Uncharacterized protein UU183 n=2 Tax=Ureaplasma parvum serovar 3 TaxID=38504 RepID=Y183_UREPA|nr:hypothetical protein [Ureaplasma parvum]Q9PQW0.1 RecName: Full=Uncharacterized protein UU183 [Ureaplasma parvum serovar 3 str. ATCC 700970]pir/B82925/ hypothetical protein UU183 [imported] - Ureaplasma urealyticum [Ureaplasma urealyticum]AAF30590.1 unique hypothetical [Ureaplasma parvum serovar 3 str. ATCC 700970]ACA32860.1 conserved hypothetical protein [Ureaplasma parvum serovar 3 str. ATCC 27815]EDT87525.1 conserved hypothetical protein [Ureaplasma parvum serovar 14 str. ATCC 33697]EDU1